MMHVVVSDIVQVQVFVEDKPTKKYTLRVPHPKLFETMAYWIGLPAEDIPGHRLTQGRNEPRLWKLELRLEGSIDKELLDKIQLEDPEIKVLSPEPKPQGVEQSIRVGVEASEPVPISIVTGPKVDEDKKVDTANPRLVSEESLVDIKILRESKAGDMKRTDTSDKSHQDDDTSEEKSQSRKTPSWRQPSKPAAPRVAIKVARGALEAAKQHAATSHNEVGGVLVGKHTEPRDKDGTFSVEIWNAIPGKNLVSRGASVTFTADTWSIAIREVEEKYGEELYIVGWYHTHPGFGIFMSGYDHFIHENYFNEPWQVALVIDPHARKEGFFAWHVNDKEEQTLEKYPEKQIEFLEGVWHPPVKLEKPTKSQEPTKEEPKQETAAPVPEPSAKQESENAPATSGREPAAANAQVTESQALPNDGALKPDVDDRSLQDSAIHSESMVRQEEKKPLSEGPTSVPTSTEAASEKKSVGKQAGIVTLAILAFASWFFKRR